VVHERAILLTKNCAVRRNLLAIDVENDIAAETGSRVSQEFRTAQNGTDL
jgi:hypothetical protein